jgi:hypothetical protein
MPKLFVARGRTVYTADGKFGPGELVDIAAEEVAYLKERGFIQDQPPVLYTEARELNPAGVGVRGANAQGPTFTR